MDNEYENDDAEFCDFEDAKNDEKPFATEADNARKAVRCRRKRTSKASLLGGDDDNIMIVQRRCWVVYHQKIT